MPVSHAAFALSLMAMAAIAPPPFTEHDQLRRACLAARRLSVTRPTPLPSASRHRCGTRGPPWPPMSPTSAERRQVALIQQRHGPVGCL